MKSATQTGNVSMRWDGTKGNGSLGRIDRGGIGTEPCNRVGDADSERTNRGRPDVRRRSLIGSTSSIHARENRSCQGCRMDSTWSLFNRGHALPLISVRFWCPRSRRARDVERACGQWADGRNGSRGYSVDLVGRSPPLRSRKVPGSPYSGHSRGHNNVPSQSAPTAIFGLTNIRTVGCLGVRSIAGLEASRRNLADHDQDSLNPIGGKLLSAINSRLSQQFQFGETNYVHT